MAGTAMGGEGCVGSLKADNHYGELSLQQGSLGCKYQLHMLLLAKRPQKRYRTSLDLSFFWGKNVYLGCYGAN